MAILIGDLKNTEAIPQNRTSALDDFFNEAFALLARKTSPSCRQANYADINAGQRTVIGHILQKS